MVRAVVYIFIAIILISFLRSIAGVLGKAFSSSVESGSDTQRAGSTQPLKGGELKRDPVCGTYVSTVTSVKKTIGGQVVHFCSKSCSDKYPQA